MKKSISLRQLANGAYIVTTTQNTIEWRCGQILSRKEIEEILARGDVRISIRK